MAESCISKRCSLHKLENVGDGMSQLTMSELVCNEDFGDSSLCCVVESSLNGDTVETFCLRKTFNPKAPLFQSLDRDKSLRFFWSTYEPFLNSHDQPWSVIEDLWLLPCYAAMNQTLFSSLLNDWISQPIVFSIIPTTVWLMLRHWKLYNSCLSLQFKKTTYHKISTDMMI